MASEMELRRWWMPLGGALAGAGLGIVIGGALAPRIYDWTTEWSVDAPLADVYAVMSRADSDFWPSMEVARIVPDARAADGKAVHYRVRQAPSVARLAPPFHIVSRMTVIEPQRRWRQIVTGDLAGVLETHFFAQPDSGSRILYNWYVRVTNPALNLAGFFLEPMFRASHDHVMREGEAGLQRHFLAVTALR
ncbi:MAG TPA: hypothetical protein VFN78_01330 [Ktedonobacterales bacterium]|nr:hypothetical protein [Ktedonobacterales bacterium]